MSRFPLPQPYLHLIYRDPACRSPPLCSGLPIYSRFPFPFLCSMRAFLTPAHLCRILVNHVYEHCSVRLSQIVARHTECIPPRPHKRRSSPYKPISLEDMGCHGMSNCISLIISSSYYDSDCTISRIPAKCQRLGPNEQLLTNK